jgi:hypothetical protein
MNCIFGHKFSKWEVRKSTYYNKDYKEPDGVTLMKFTKEVQSRKCLKCGYIEEVDV